MTEALFLDREVRQRVLDPEGSYFLRAPAGSGKTGLLVQRVLRLLAEVAQPEEILAITFTRKAAAEMRDRVLSALAGATGPEPRSAYARETWCLARAALARDAECAWQLLAQPGRLRIQTLDAFCAAIARRHPLQAGLGGVFDTTEEAAALYQEAAKRCLHRGPREAWETLLAALDNRVDELVAAIAKLLAKREQWLPLLVGLDSTARGDAEASLAAAVAERLREIRAALAQLPTEQWAAVLPEVLSNAASVPELKSLEGLNDLPAAVPEALPQWRALAELLLTQSGAPRVRLGAAQGVAVAAGASQEVKQRVEQLKRRLAALIDGLGDPGAKALQLARQLPEPVFTPLAWQKVSAAVRLLIHAAGELKLVFAERGEVDFTETALAAVGALGTPDAPTDLLLALDYRIRHILVDEFQDTSQLQIDLLQRLTGGWAGESARSLFLVGDGMQSIYGFRNARVDLFREVMNQGVGDLVLTNEALTSNFRASEALVAWVNRVFGLLSAPASAGFFVPATAQGSGGEAPQWHRLSDRASEARRVADLVAAAQAAEPQGHVGILVRARSHLEAIVPTLKEAGLEFQAIDVDPLGELPVVQDLLMLTRVLLRPADRLAWLALFHSPGVGLTLEDLTVLAGQLGEGAWTATRLRDALPALPEGPALRLARALAVLHPALAAQGRQALRPLVEAVWLGLGGPAAADNEGRAAAELFFATLARHESAGRIAEWAAFEGDLEKLFAPPAASPGPRLSIMTLHKAKGLEFDTVILPGLDRKSPGGGRELLRWKALGHNLLLSPMPPRGQARDAIDRLLGTLEASEQEAENLRLAYVAVTRAKTALHLLAVLPDKEPGKPKEPPAGSLLARLWAGVAHEVRAKPVESVAQREPTGARSKTAVRLALNSTLPQWPAPLPTHGAPALSAAPVLPFDWAQEEARVIGVVTHQLLQIVAQKGAEAWTTERLATLAGLTRNLLRDRGLSPERWAAAQASIAAALVATLEDARGRWILSNTHQEARSEWALSGLLDGELVQLQIDRSFVAQGCRWIIDFKTGVHAGGNLAAFLDAEQARYAPQLDRYARLLALREYRPIRLALYFPRLKGWREWVWAASK